MRSVPSFPKEYNRTSIDSAEAVGKTILYLIHYFYPDKRGGTERFTLNIAKEMERSGCRPIVLTLEGNQPESSYDRRCGNILYRYYEYEKIRCIAFRHKKAPLGLYYKEIRDNDMDMRNFAKFILQKEGIDIVHATYPQPFASFLFECLELKIPYIVSCTDFALSCHYSTMIDSRGDFCPGSFFGNRCKKVCKSYGCRDFGKRWQTAERLLLGARVVTVPSEFVARVMSREFPHVGFIPVPHGIASEFLSYKKRRAVKKFVYAGTLAPLKGVHLLISAFKRLGDDSLSLSIYGSGDERYIDSLRAAADERISFLGPVSAEDMPSVYADADCVVVPSLWYETYNFVLREALASGALVVAADIGAMSEAVEVGQNGFLFRAGDGDDLYRTLLLAVKFDFSNYRKSTLPSPEKEASFYLSAYGE